MGDRGPRTIHFDPHVHTDASHDCSTQLETVLAAARDADLDAIAVTDHDEIDASLRAVERAPAFGLSAIPGVEVSTTAGHLLALWVTERPPAGRSLETTIQDIHDQGGMAVVPHPFQVSRHGVRKRRLDGATVDAIEVFNAWTMTGVQNRRARRFAARQDLARIGASDAHSAPAVGRAYTVVELPTDATAHDASGGVPDDALRAALAAGHTSPGGEGSTVAQYVGKYARTIGSRTSGLRPGRLFSADRL